MLLHSLWRGKDLKSKTDRYVVESEIYDLLNQDIPYFYFAVNERNLYNSRGRKMEDYFAETPFENCLKKLNSMNTDDLERQKMFIHLSLSPTGEERLDGTALYRAFTRLLGADYQEIVKEQIHTSETKRELIRAAKSIADKLGDEAIVSEENGEIGWFSYRVMSRKTTVWSIQPCNIYLYDGIAGIAIFFHQFLRYSQEEKYCRICQMLDKQLFRYTNLMEQRIKGKRFYNSGLFTGEASLLYTYLSLYQLHHDKKYLNYAKKHAEIVYRTAMKDQCYDLLEGKAGAVWALCQMAEYVPEQKYIKWAESVAANIIEHAEHMQKGIRWRNSTEGQPLLGMAHGNAGISVALCKLYQMTGDVRLYQCVKAAVVYEHENFNKETGDWIDFRGVNAKTDEIQSNKIVKPAAWCHGAGGILLSRIEMWDIEWEDKTREMIRQDIESAASYLKKNWARKEFCLCHGVCGNLMIWDRYNRWREGDEAALFKADDENDMLTCEFYNSGLMSGYTGVGYYFLVKVLKCKCKKIRTEAGRLRTEVSF